MFGAAGAGVGLSHGYDGSDETGFSGQQEDEIFLFVNEWLCAIADYSMGLLIVELLRIESFSAEGREQLRVDLEYLRFPLLLLCSCLHLPCLPQQCNQCAGYQTTSSVSPLALSSPARSSTTPHPSRIHSNW
jgi:hypothetical protein